MKAKLTKALPICLIAALMLTVCFSLGFSLNATATADASPTTGYSEKHETITIAHISDVHYFPLEYCYAYTTDADGNNIETVDKTSELFENSDFNDATYGDTKLVTESGAIMNAIIQNIYNQAVLKADEYAAAFGTANQDAAEDALDTIPDIVILTGDLTKNSERVALIDVANAFRFLQNEMREISYNIGGADYYPFEYFQVLAVPGNHDLYNGSAKIYDNIRDNGIVDGTEFLTDTADTRLFAMIFAGLGFPNVNEDIMNNVLREQVKYGETALDTGLSNTDYWYGALTGEYVYSVLAKNLNLSYYSDALQNISEAKSADFATAQEYYAYLINQYSQIGSKNNTLSYAVEVLTCAPELGSDSTGYSIVMCDGSDRQTTDNLVPIAANAEQILARKDLYTFDETSGVYTKLPENATTIKNAIVAGKTVYYNTKLDHITGGKVTEEFLDWLQNDVMSTLTGNSLQGAEETIIFAVHQNVLPHFDQEDDLLKDFTIYNWEYVTKRLLAMGVRYTLSGHMHSSDIASYVDAAGRVLYDFETGSTVSYSGPVRYLNIDRYYYFNYADNFVAENLYSSIDVLDSLAEIQTSNIVNPVPFSDIDVSAYTTDAEKFNARFAVNPDYYLYCYSYDEIKSLSFNEYIDEEIYSRLLTRMLDHFLSMDMINEVLGSLDTFFETTFRTMLGGSFADYADVTQKLVDSIIDQVLNGMTYTYNGAVYTGTANDPGAVKMLRAIVDDFINRGYGVADHKIQLRELVVDLLVNHTTGNEFTSLNAILNPEVPAEGGDFDRYYLAMALREFILSCEDGSLVEDLLNTLLDPILLDDTSFIKTLLAYNFDFSGLNLTDNEKTSANSMFALIVELLNGIAPAGSPQLTSDLISLDHFCLGDILNSAQSFISSVASGFGLSMGDMSITEFAEDFISKYMVESFFTGTGGIVKNIVVSLAVDNVQDLANRNDPSQPYFLRYADDYEFDPNYAYIQETPSEEMSPYFTYVQGQTVSDTYNAPTTENGRLPSKLTSNFDTQNPTSEYVFSYYTDEFIYTKFEILNESNEVVATVETSPESTVTYNTTYTEPGKLGWEVRSDSATANGISISLTTTAVPVYMPEIDLGLACLTHSEITYEVGDNEYYYSSEMRDGDLDRPELHISNYVVFDNRHIIKITGLEAGRTYKYRVYGTYGDKEYALNTALGCDYLTMTTAPTSAVTSFSFLAIADLQASILADYEVSSEVFNKIKTSGMFDYDFILNAGDMTDNGKNYYQWGWALDTMNEYFANTSMFNTAGNHESGTNALTNFFDYSHTSQVTEDGIYYSLDYGNLHLIVLNTNDADSKGLGAAQLAWLKADLEANDSEWTVVLMHKGLYTAGSHSKDTEVVAMRAQLTKLFAENGVDLVLAGHDHTYTTTCVLDKDGNIVKSAVDSDGYVVNADVGVIYMTLGTMGEKYYTYGYNPDVNPKFNYNDTVSSTLENPTFSYFTVDGDKLVISGYQYDNDTTQLNKISDIKLTKKLGDVGEAVANAKINETTPLVFGEKVTFGYFSYNNQLNINLSDCADGLSIAYFVDGKEVDGLNFGFLEGSKDVEIKIKDAEGNYTSLGVVEMVRDGFVLYTILIFLGIAVLCAAIVVAILLAVAKKKKGSNDGDGSTEDKSTSEDTVAAAEKTAEAENVKNEVTSDTDMPADEKPAEQKVELTESVSVETEKPADAEKPAVKKPAVKKSTAKKASDSETAIVSNETLPVAKKSAAKKPAAKKPTADQTDNKAE